MIPYATCRAPLRVSATTVIPVCDHWNRGKMEVLSTQDGQTRIQVANQYQTATAADNYGHSNNPKWTCTWYLCFSHTRYEDAFTSGETVHEHGCVLFSFLTVLFLFGQVCKIVKEHSDMSFMLIAVSPEEKVSSYMFTHTHTHTHIHDRVEEISIIWATKHCFDSLWQKTWASRKSSVSCRRQVDSHSCDHRAD